MLQQRLTYRYVIMGNPKICVVDYGLGNLLSVMSAAQKCGADTLCSSEPDKIIQCDKIILPGVGAFNAGMNALNMLGLVDVIRHAEKIGIPILGICLGMQLLFDKGEEFGSTKGLSLMEGSVVPIPATNNLGERIKVPHIGWNSLIETDRTWENTILRGYEPSNSVYFVHSFVAEPKYQDYSIANFRYANMKFPACVQKGNVYGCQFHPEKSGETGLKILRNFISQTK